MEIDLSVYRLVSLVQANWEFGTSKLGVRYKQTGSLKQLRKFLGLSPLRVIVRRNDEARRKEQQRWYLWGAFQVLAHDEGIRVRF